MFLWKNKKNILWILLSGAMSVTYSITLVFELKFYSLVSIVKVMLSQLVNLLTLFLGRLSPLTG